MFARFGRRGSGRPATPGATTGQPTPEEYARTLGQVPLFLDLSKRELQRLSASCVQRDYPAGAVLVRQGEPGAGLFVLVSGRVRVAQHQEGGDEHELATMGPGEVLGEMTLMDDLPRSATVTALEPTRVLLLPFQDFRAALREDADITIKLLAVVSRRLRRAETRKY
jgi:CRP/FNR family transcriptional regulator, cyclic AMP receptor protein